LILIKSNYQHFDCLDEFPFLKIEVIDKDKGLPELNFFKKLTFLWKIKLLKHKYSPRLINFLKLRKVEFVYPIALPNTLGLNSAGWVADFQHRNFPNVINSEFTDRAENWITSELTYSSKVVLSSEFCKNDCQQFFPEFLNKTIVMPFAVYLKKALLDSDKLKLTLLKYNIQHPFFIISNLFAVTKNHRVVFEALGRLKDSGVIINLYCTGNIVDERDLGFADEILKFVSSNKISGQVHFLGLIPREDQISLYRLALAMIQPSLSEGWSTCVEEAKNLGKDMLLSDIGVHREQWPDNPWFFNPTNSEELAVKMLQLFELNKLEKFPVLDKENQAIKNYENNFFSFANAIQKVMEFK